MSREHRARGAWGLLVVGLVAMAIGLVAGRWWAARDARGDAAEHADAADEEGATYYTCGMHPWVMLPEPGLCPICHMELTPVSPARAAGQIVIDPATVQNIGVRMSAVVRGPAVRHVRTVGSVEYDPTRIRVATTKFAGWIERLHVAAEGATVEAGDPLLDLYSPELYAAQVEYLVAYRGRERPGGDALLDSARTRLAYLDVSPQQIRQLEQSGEASRTLTIHSPHSGVVTELMVREGSRIEAGMPTHRIADVSRVWVLAAVYEHEMPLAQVGQKATVTLPLLNGRTFEGEVGYVYPWVDEGSRQGRVRVELDNAGGVLKPGMFAAVQIASVDRAEALLAPREAILATGERQVAFVSLGQGRFDPREVTTGIVTSDGMIEVLGGLREGEMVVTSGQFLLDSESRLRSALAKMTQPEELPAVQGEAGHVHAGLRETVDAGTQAATDEIIAHYLGIREALARDSTSGVDEHYAAIHKAAASVGDPLVAAVAEAAATPPEEIDALRERFESLSSAVIALVSVVPPSTGQTLRVAHCPMVDAHWIQTQTPVSNPYMGSAMPHCGTIEYSIAPRSRDPGHTGGAP